MISSTGCHGSKYAGASKPRRARLGLVALSLTLGLCGALLGEEATTSETVLPSGAPAGEPVASGRPLDLNTAEAAFWLQNMVWYHRFSTAEITAATGAEATEIANALQRFNIRTDNRPARRADDPLRVLPYPGGRHPRIGFLEGAIHPQRETKLSVFTPWDDTSYVVADVPEAIWSNLGLTYLAHTHIDTIWDVENKVLEPLEWQRLEHGGWRLERELPNGIRFGTEAVPDSRALRMRMWLRNGTAKKLTDLRVQNCVMLKGARGFTAQTNDNKRFIAPYAVGRSDDGGRWIISAWVPNQRSWGNEQCPCLHSDPQFPDCEPGQTQTLRGWLSFYEGDDIEGELARITATGWQEARSERD